MFEVIVVGGGPSGLNSALKLADSGLEVAVLEKKKEIGKNIVCTGIVGKEAFERFALNTNSILTEVQEFKMISPRRTSVVYAHPEPFAYVVDREKFDKNLAEKARAKGAILKLGYHVIDVTLDKNFVRVAAKARGLKTEVYRAKAVILATGIHSHFNRKLGLGYSKEYFNGIQAEIFSRQSGCPEIFVGNNIASGAFAWVVPINGEKVRIGLLTQNDPYGCFNRFIKNFNPKMSADLSEDKIQSRPIAQGLLTKTYGNRVLAVGEAAGQVKTTTGGGIFYGLLCSDLASRVISENIHENCLSADALSEYEKLWKKAIQKEILVGYYTRKICEKLSDSQIENMFQIAKSDGVIPLLRSKGNFDWQSEVIMALAKKAPIRSIQAICRIKSLG